MVNADVVCLPSQELRGPRDRNGGVAGPNGGARWHFAPQVIWPLRGDVLDIDRY